MKYSMEYCKTPFLYNAYLDWVILDVLTLRKVVALRHAYYMASRGITYALSGYVPWRIMVFRPVLLLLAWGLPTANCFFIAQWSIPAAIAVGVVWYGAYALSLITSTWSKISQLWTLKETVAQKLGRTLGEASQAYTSLAGPILYVPFVRRAFDRAVEKGVVWDQLVVRTQRMVP